MNGHAPRLDSLARLAEVLNLDLYFGPPHGTPVPAATTATPAERPVPGPTAPGPDARDVLAAIRALNRVVHALGPAAGRAAPAPARAAVGGDRLHAVGDRWFRDDWMRRRGLDPSVCRLAEVTGSDMEPTLPDGTVVLVDRADRDPQPVSVYLLRLVDGHRVRRLGLEGNRWRMLGDHPHCPPIDLPNTARIVGRVAWSAREHPADGRDGLGTVYEMLARFAVLRAGVAAGVDRFDAAGERDELRRELGDLTDERFARLLGRLADEALRRPDGARVLRRALANAGAAER